MRIFASGAIRDDNHNKYEYAKALDPRVLKAYLAFLHRHAEMPDGSYRPVDNWKKGMAESFLDSLVRHVIDLWEIEHHGESFRPENGLAVEPMEAACAILFNIHGWMYERLKANASKRADLSAGAEGGRR